MIEVTTNGWLKTTFDTPEEVANYIKATLEGFREPLRFEITRPGQVDS
jgi:hypothetical protein